MRLLRWFTEPRTLRFRGGDGVLAIIRPGDTLVVTANVDVEPVGLSSPVRASGGFTVSVPCKWDGRTLSMGQS